MGSSIPTASEAFIALVRSLMCSSIRKPGLKLRSRIMGAFASITVLPARPPRIALYTFSGFTPDFAASTIASDSAAMFTATMIWFASFVIFPLPIGPTSTTEEPIFSKIGRTFSNTSSFPPHMKDKVASTALGSPPLTGASIISPPAAVTAFSNSTDTVGSMELISTMMVPFFIPSNTPSFSRSAFFT